MADEHREILGTINEDAGAGGAAARRQPQAEPNTHCTSWKAAGLSGRQAKALPQQGRSG